LTSTILVNPVLVETSDKLVGMRTRLVLAVVSFLLGAGVSVGGFQSAFVAYTCFAAAGVLALWSLVTWEPVQKWLLRKLEPFRIFKHKRELERELADCRQALEGWREVFESGNFWIVLRAARGSAGKVGDCRLVSDCDSEEYPEHMRPRVLAEKYNELRGV